ncbi:MAG: hypothetical protein ACRD3C_00315 [Vicinamibacterales bacterium]
MLMTVSLSLFAQQAVPDIVLTNGKINDIRPVLTMVGGRVAFHAAAESPTATR